MRCRAGTYLHQEKFMAHFSLLLRYLSSLFLPSSIYDPFRYYDYRIVFLLYRFYVYLIYI